jgi:hypothetical protein
MPDAVTRLTTKATRAPHFPPSFAQCLQYFAVQALQGSEPVHVEATTLLTPRSRQIAKANRENALVAFPPIKHHSGMNR